MSESARLYLHPTPPGRSFYTGPRPYRRRTPKVGRNAPCPCGCGRKAKRCRRGAQ